VLLVALAAVAAALLGWAPGLWFAGALIAALLLHLVAGGVLARLSARAYLSLLIAPVYILWKCWVYFTAMLGRSGGGWIRTGRGEAAEGQNS
jgi:hypothetical protein